MGTMRERAQQLKEKRPGYGEILDFYVKVRESQAAAKVSSKVDMGRVPKERRDPGAREGLPLLRKEDFPVDIDASVALFHTLCAMGRTANPHMAAEVKKIEQALSENRLDLKKLITDGGSEQEVGHSAAGQGLDGHVLAFLVLSSIRPSIEAGREQLDGELDPETLRKGHCPVCGSLPSLNLLKGEGGKRYSLCSYCGFQWRIDRLSCPVCGSQEPDDLSYFFGEGEENCRIELCDKCHHYIKTVDLRNLELSDPCLEDLGSLHLDILAARKGYMGAVPNPWTT